MLVVIDDTHHNSLLKRKNSGAWVIYTFGESSTFQYIIVQSIGKTLQSLIQSLPDDQCCYVVLNFESNKEITTNKIVLVSYAPDSAPVKDRLKTSFYLKDIKNTLDVRYLMQANCKDDIYGITRF